jgi:hypothetical protein
MHRIVFPSMILFTCSCCCALWPLSRHAALPMPSDQDVIGIYQVTSQNLTDDGLEVFSGHQPLITINNDGTCVVSDFPTWTFSYEIGEWLSFSGQWSIVRGDGVNWQIICKSADELVRGDLSEDRDGYVITFPYGDPDSYDFMLFSKAP